MREASHYYTGADGVKMAELQVDSCKAFQEMMCDLKYGGNLNVRFLEGNKNIFMLGHDKCIFKQFQLEKVNKKRSGETSLDFDAAILKRVKK